MRRSIAGAAAAAALLLTACADGSEPPLTELADDPTPSAAPTIKVVASTDVYGGIAERIGGARAEVTSIISGGSAADPHSYEASARDQLAVSDAELVIANGGHYDEFLNRLLDAADGEGRVITATEIADTHADNEAHTEEYTSTDDASTEEDAHTDEDAHDHSGEGNEHVWYDLAAIHALAGEIGDALAELDPSGRETFESNADTFRLALEGLQGRQADLRTEHEGEAVAITEAVPLYLLTDAGLVNRTPAEFSEAIEEGTDVPVRLLQETLELFSGGQVKALVYNEQTTGPQTEQIREAAEAAGIPVVAVSETLPEGKDYVSWMSENLDALREALESAS